MKKLLLSTVAGAAAVVLLTGCSSSYNDLTPYGFEKTNKGNIIGTIKSNPVLIESYEDQKKYVKEQNKVIKKVTDTLVPMFYSGWKGGFKDHTIKTQMNVTAGEANSKGVKIEYKMKGIDTSDSILVAGMKVYKKKPFKKQYYIWLEPVVENRDDGKTEFHSLKIFTHNKCEVVDLGDGKKNEVDCSIQSDFKAFWRMASTMRTLLESNYSKQLEIGLKESGLRK